MTVIQTPSKALGTGGRMSISGSAVVLAVVIVAAIAAAVLATSLIARQNAVGAQADPNLAPAAIEFRAAEHAAAGSQADPLLKPAAVEFRADEHAAGGLSLQAIESLRGESAATGVQQVPQKRNPVEFKFGR
jgi:hypothetical protein